MGNYAIIENDLVNNVVVWDGTGDVFSGATTLELSDTLTANVGDAYVSGEIIHKPRDGYDYTFDTTTSKWVMTAASITQKAADTLAATTSKKATLLATAMSTISLWQTELSLGTISDDDKASLTSWVAYIKALDAVDLTVTDPAWPTVP